MSHDVAVVLPWAGGQEDWLLRQLQRLREQDIEDGLDIRIAVNAPVGRTTAERLTAMSGPGRAVRVIDATARRGAAYARNRGAAAGPARHLLFCDADDQADAAWARHLVDALRAGADLVGGSLDYGPLNRTPFALSRASALPVAFGHLPFTPSASLGIAAAAFQRIGGFNESLLSGEDIDLCWRAQYAGARLAYAPEAVMSYRLRQSWRSLFDQGRRYGRSDVQLFELHRAHDLTRPLSAVVGELARVVGLGALALRSPAGRLKFAVKLGTVVGHAEGSLTARRLFL